jgi:hypothetical protein
MTYERDAAVALLNEPSAGGEGPEASASPAAPPVTSGSGVRLGTVRLASRPAVATKSEAPGRPAGGYSMAGDEIVDEADASRITERPPRP